MPIYRHNKLIHIHIPKTGGTAIEQFFSSIGDMQWHRGSWVGQERYQGRWYEYQHLSMQELVSLAGDEIAGFHPFAVVRNPYSRLLSDFDWRLWMGRDHPSAAIRLFDSLKDMVKAIPDDINTNWQGRISTASQQEANFLIHVRPQYQYICDERGKRAVEVILKFDRLDRDFRNFLERYGLRTDTIRRPSEKDIAAHYERDMLDRVNHIYAKDFALGGYEML